MTEPTQQPGNGEKKLQARPHREGWSETTGEIFVAVSVILTGIYLVWFFIVPLALPMLKD